jgi:general stress protein 26
MKGYGIPAHTKGMLDWRDVRRRLLRARNYWIGTTRPDGRPHAAPVWAVWHEEALYFGTDRRSRKARNLAAMAGTAIHLESGDEAVILEGAAEEVVDRALIDRIDGAYLRKYKMRLTEAPGSLVVYAIRPRVALAWRERDFPRSATRWHFGEDSRVQSRPR